MSMGAGVLDIVRRGGLGLCVVNGDGLIDGKGRLAWSLVILSVQFGASRREEGRVALRCMSNRNRCARFVEEGSGAVSLMTRGYLGFSSMLALQEVSWREPISITHLEGE